MGEFELLGGRVVCRSSRELQATRLIARRAFSLLFTLQLTMQHNSGSLLDSCEGNAKSQANFSIRQGRGERAIS